MNFPDEPDFATGDCVISMDADLQHPPEIIPRLIAKWHEGYEVVTTVRNDATHQSIIKTAPSRLFYRIMNALADIRLQPGMADFRLLDRKVVDVARNLDESHLFWRGLFIWIGFRQCSIDYIPSPRHSGKTKYTLNKMVSLALQGLTAFSIKPLRLSTILGVFISGCAFLYAVYAVYMALFTDVSVPGWASVLVSVLLMGGIQLIVLGVIGEYLGKLFMQAKHRPHYIIRESHLPHPRD